jgi:hypothetical protein
VQEAISRMDDGDTDLLEDPNVEVAREFGLLTVIKDMVKYNKSDRKGKARRYSEEYMIFAKSLLDVLGAGAYERVRTQQVGLSFLSGSRSLCLSLPPSLRRCRTCVCDSVSLSLWMPYLTSTLRNTSFFFRSSHCRAARQPTFIWSV